MLEEETGAGGAGAVELEGGSGGIGPAELLPAPVDETGCAVLEAGAGAAVELLDSSPVELAG